MQFLSDQSYVGEIFSDLLALQAEGWSYADVDAPEKGLPDAG